MDELGEEKNTDRNLNSEENLQNNFIPNHLNSDFEFNVSKQEKSIDIEDIDVDFEDQTLTDIYNSKEYKDFELEEENPLSKKLNLTDDEPTVITVNNSDGTKKTIVLGFEEIKPENKEDIIKRQLTELKDYINSNKVDSVEVKKGDKYHKKIDLKDFIAKELGTINYNSNPEKLGEDLIMSLLKPLEIYNKYLNQSQLEKDQTLEKPKEKALYTVKINDEEFQFKKYSEDYTKLIVENKEGKSFEIENNKNINFIISPVKEFNGIELNLLQKGKTLMVSDKDGLPFKVSSNKEENGLITFQTVTNKEYLDNNKIFNSESKKEENVLSQKEEKTKTIKQDTRPLW
jgi:hypothetical protein